MFILEANGTDPISISLDDGTEVEIKITELKNSRVEIVVCVEEDRLVYLEHLNCDPRFMSE